MATQTAIQTTSGDRLRTYIRQPEVMTRFEEILGKWQASAYVASVLIAVASNEALQVCSFSSVASSALRAATLRLSCDPATGQAYLVPFSKKATLVVGYKGLYHMALRTGKYRFINVAKVREGEYVEEDWMTGLHKLRGSKTGDKVIGWCLFFELFSGYAKSFYMSVDEIHEHAQRYSKSYNRQDSPWKTNPADMEKKTVLRLGLSKWGYLDPHDVLSMNATDEQDLPDDNTVDAEFSAAPRPANQIMSELGFDPEPEEQPAPEPPAGENGGDKQAEQPAFFPASKMTLETAQSVKDSHGTPYGELSNEELSNRTANLNKTAKDKGKTPEQREQAQFKLDAICTILQARNGNG
jgi:phage RecT family recombinase